MHKQFIKGDIIKNKSMYCFQDLARLTFMTGISFFFFLTDYCIATSRDSSVHISIWVKLPLSVSPRSIAEICSLATLDVHPPAWPGSSRYYFTISELHLLRFIWHNTWGRKANLVMMPNNVSSKKDGKCVWVAPGVPQLKDDVIWHRIK